MKINIRTINVYLLLSLFGMVFLSNAAVAQDQVVYIKIEVDGLSCPFCAYGLEKNLKKIKEAKDVYISVKDGYTTFSVPKNSSPSEEDLKVIVENAGFATRKIIFSETPFKTDEG